MYNLFYQPCKFSIICIPVITNIVINHSWMSFFQCYYKIHLNPYRKFLQVQYCLAIMLSLECFLESVQQLATKLHLNILMIIGAFLSTYVNNLSYFTANHKINTWNKNIIRNLQHNKAKSCGNSSSLSRISSLLWHIITVVKCWFI